MFTSFGVYALEVMDNPNLARASVDVDAGGNFDFSLPLYAPGGTAGHTPVLILKYDGFSNGQLGRGWKLAGPSMISRCLQSVEFGDLDFDKHRPAIVGADTDRFCLGAEPLVHVKGSSYTSVPSEYRIASMPSAKVQLLTGSNGSYFRLDYGNGSVMFFGNNDQASLKNAAGRKLLWALNESQDRGDNGTSIRFDYELHSNHLLLVNVRYNHSVSSGLVEDSHFLQFEYLGDRHDTSVTFFAGLQFERNRRLAHITVKDRQGANEAPHTVRTYDLTYEDEGVRPVSRLKYITECHDSFVEDPACFREYSIGWTSTNSALTQDDTESLSLPGLKDFKFGDLNGDGQRELVYVIPAKGSLDRKGKSNGSIVVAAFDHTINAFTPGQVVKGVVLPDYTERKSWHLYDYDGDNNDDLLYLKNAGGKLGWHIRRSSRASFAADSEQAIGLTSELANGEIPKAEVFDFNADGHPDILTRAPADEHNATRFQIAYGQGGSFSPPVQVKFDAADIGIAAFDVVEYGFGRLKAADFDGNGQSDILAKVEILEARLPGDPDEPRAKRQQHWIVFCASGRGTFRAMVDLGRVGPSGMPQTLDQLRVADLNGDSLADILFEKPGSTSDSSTWAYRLSTGVSFSSVNDVPRFTGMPNRQMLRRHLRVLDYDDDGANDLVYPGGSPAGRYLVKRWQGGEFAAQDAEMQGKVAVGSIGNLSVFEDINGDSLFDHWRYNKDEASESQVLSLQDPALLQPVDKISNVTLLTSTGEDYVQIEYALLKPGTDFYRKSKPETGPNPWGRGSPVFEVHDPLWAVSKMTVSPSSDGYYTDGLEKTYKYRGGRFQAGGRGFLGFRKFIETDLVNGTETKTVFHQKHPLTFRREKITQVDTNSGRLSKEVRYCWAVRAMDTGEQNMTYLAKLVEDTYSHLLFITNKTRNVQLHEVDQFGNSDRMTVYSTKGKEPVNCNTTAPKGVARAVTTTEYQTDLVTRRVDRATAIRVSQLGGLWSTVRETSFEYQGDLLSAIHRDHNPESKHPEQWEVFGRDRLGHINFKAKCSDQVDSADECLESQRKIATPRTNEQLKHYVRYEFDPAGRYVDSEYRLRKDENGTIEEYLAAKVIKRDIYGNPVDVVDETGAQTSLNLD